jgi:hypothetical protein
MTPDNAKANARAFIALCAAMPDLAAFAPARQ